MPFPQTLAGLTVEDFDSLCRDMTLLMALEARLEASRGVSRILQKQGYDGEQGSDIVTSVDLRAQRALVNFLTSHNLLEKVGLICEEEGVGSPPPSPEDPTLTVDPFDGTRGFIRAVKDGKSLEPDMASAMLGVSINGEPVAGYICDVASLTLYSRSPYSSSVYRTLHGGVPEDISNFPQTLSLAEGMLQVKGSLPPSLQSLPVAGVQAREFGGFGLGMMRVLCGSFAGMVRPARHFTTPWDDMPVSALCKAADVIGLYVAKDGLREFKPDLSKVCALPSDVLYVPRRYIEEIRQTVAVTTMP